MGRSLCKAMNGLVASWTATPATALGCSTRPLPAVRSCIEEAPPAPWSAVQDGGDLREAGFGEQVAALVVRVPPVVDLLAHR